MTANLDQVGKLLTEEHLDWTRVSDGTLRFPFPTSNLTDREGRRLYVYLTACDGGHYLAAQVRHALHLRGEHVHATMNLLHRLQEEWQLVRFDYDHVHGEICPSLEIPFGAMQLDAGSLALSIRTLIYVVELTVPAFEHTVKTGEILVPGSSAAPSPSAGIKALSEKRIAVPAEVSSSELALLGMCSSKSSAPAARRRGQEAKRQEILADIAEALAWRVSQAERAERPEKPEAASSDVAARWSPEAIFERLSSRVLNQDTAVRTVSERLAVTMTGLAVNPERPLGVFLFVGPPGVGKTELAKAIAEDLLYDADCLIRLDMSEYQNNFTAARLIGPPPGTVGFNEPANWLTTRLGKRPRSVVLLDEVEKAAPEVIQLFLPALDAGRLTDSRGNTVSFASSIVVMTSNLGVREAERSAIGFASDPADRRNQSVDQAIRQQLAPEMISRLDDIVHFDALDGRASSDIARHHLDRHLDNLRLRGLHLDIADEARQLVPQSESAGRYGFRHLERNMERLLFTGLAGRQPGTYRCEVADGQLHWTLGR